MGWLLVAWLTGCAAVLLLIALGAWLLTGTEYRGVHRGPAYPAHHRLHEDERTVIMRWDGERFAPAPPWT